MSDMTSSEHTLSEMPQETVDEKLQSFSPLEQPAEEVPTLTNRILSCVYWKWVFALLGLIYTLCACLLPSVPGREGDDMPADGWVPFIYIVAMSAFLYPYYERSSFKKNLDLGFRSVSKMKNEFLKRPNYRTSAIVFLLVVVAAGVVGLAFAPATADGVKNQRPEEVGGEWHYRLRAFSGLLFFIGISAVVSTNRKAIAWRTVASCLLNQFLLALFVLRTDLGFNLFKVLAERATVFTNWYRTGASFVFGADAPSNFALTVVPTIVFYSSFISCLYYCGFMSWAIGCIATAFKKILGEGITGREVTIGVANIFLGQTESPLLIKPLMSKMSDSEIHCMMTTGFSTIAGSVFGAFLNFGVDGRTLICASVMNAPAGIAISKLFRPETERIRSKLPTHEGEEVIIDEMEEIKMMIEESKKENEEANILHAAGNGAVTGFFLALNVMAVLIAFLALYAFLDSMLGYVFAVVGIPDVSFAMVFGYVFYPIAWLMGVPLADCQTVAKLISKKTLINEFAAYSELSDLMTSQKAAQVLDSTVITLSKRAETIAIYALCGFSNVASIGVQIGGLGVLAPSKKKEFARMGVSAMIAGSIACFTTASIAGMLI